MTDSELPIEISAAARAEQPIVERLLQLYLHDFSEFAGARSAHGRIAADGRFPYQPLDRYWREEGCSPLLARVAGDLAGFVLLNRQSATGEPVNYVVAEFFVMRKYRRAGIGTRVAREVIEARPGFWEIPVAHYNAPALVFWRHVVATLPARDLRERKGDGTRWSGTIFRFRIG